MEKFVEDMAKAKHLTAADVENDFFRTMRPSSIIQRFATPDEVAALVVFVASRLSSAANRGGVARGWRDTAVDLAARGRYGKQCMMKTS